MPESDDRSGPTEPPIPAMPTGPTVDPAAAVRLVKAKVDQHATAVADLDAVVEQVPFPTWRLHVRNVVRVAAETSYTLGALAYQLELERRERERGAR